MTIKKNALLSGRKLRYSSTRGGRGTAIVIVHHDLKKSPSVTRGTILDDGFKSDIEGFESNNDASGARLI